MLTNTTVRTLPLNTQGTDYVVGDIHGCFDLVDQALARLGFAPDQDRLLCVGDLIDRGPQSAQVDAFLARPYVYAVRGNHTKTNSWRCTNTTPRWSTRLILMLFRLPHKTRY